MMSHDKVLVVWNASFVKGYKFIANSCKKNLKKTKQKRRKRKKNIYTHTHTYINKIYIDEKTVI